jgi:hypothetical protein
MSIFPQNGQVINTSLSVDSTGKEKTLMAQIGPLKNLQLKSAASHAAFKGLKAINDAKIKGETQIALTAVNLTTREITTTMVSNAMVKQGVLTTQLNSNTAAVDQAITNGVLAESATHINNRDINKHLLSELKSQGKMTSKEHEELSGLAEADAVGDILRSRARGDAARKVAETIHSLALNGMIISGQEKLGRNR